MKPTFLITGTNAERFNRYGDVIHTPLIELTPVTELNQVELTLNALTNFHWIIFTSRHAVMYFLQALARLNLDVRALAGLRIASIGQTTTAELKKSGMLPDIQSSEESSEGLVSLFQKREIKNENILLPCSDIALPTLPNGLALAGYTVTSLTVYNNSLPENVKSVSLSKIDYIVFSSPSCVVNFYKIYPIVTQKMIFIVQGKETRKKLQEYGIAPENIRERGFLNTLPTY